MQAIVFDADGMLVHGPRFSSRLEQAFGIPVSVTAPFFGNQFQECLVGKVDLKEILSEHIEAWGWKGDVESLLSFWFAREAHNVDARFGPVISRLRERGLKTILATNNEKCRTAYLVETCGLGAFFDGICSSAHLGCKKPEVEFFFKVAHQIGSDPEEISFWDDDPENVDGAAAVGFQANLYRDFDGFCESNRHLIC